MPQRNSEDVLCSKTRLKILKLLVDSQLTPSEIARAVGVNYVITEQHLEILESEGILAHAKFGNESVTTGTTKPQKQEQFRHSWKLFKSE
jgi:predicted transcriptional regulator